ncbi:hypothetical protein CR513_31770, partial [Mucuna pruriens]
MDRSMVNTASGGVLMDKTPIAVKHLISNMASNTQQLGIRGASQPRMLTKLTSLVRKLAIGQQQPNIAARVYGIFTFVEHLTDMFPTLQEAELDYLESVGALSGYQYEKQPAKSRAIYTSTIQICLEHTSRTNRLSTTDFAISSTTIPATTTTENANSRKLTISRGLDESVDSSNLPLQIIPNPRGNVSVVTLRSGKELPQSSPQQLPRPTNADFEPDA